MIINPMDLGREYIGNRRSKLRKIVVDTHSHGIYRYLCGSLKAGKQDLIHIPVDLINDQIQANKDCKRDQALHQSLFKSAEIKFLLQPVSDNVEINKMGQEVDCDGYQNDGDRPESHKQQGQRNQRAQKRPKDSHCFLQYKFFVGRNYGSKNTCREIDSKVDRQDHKKLLRQCVFRLRQSLIKQKACVIGQIHYARKRNQSDDKEYGDIQPIQPENCLPVIILPIPGKEADVAGMKAQAENTQHGNGGQYRLIEAILILTQLADHDWCVNQTDYNTDKYLYI